ncbi:hypothetical protein C8R45DRAFT_939362 [Mycena sanguinolenta]|nr:hypothetical protein C8R45DRAFT_939362 [Mycena sanguinolenta]
MSSPSSTCRAVMETAQARVFLLNELAGPSPKQRKDHSPDMLAPIAEEHDVHAKDEAEEGRADEARKERWTAEDNPTRLYLVAVNNNAIVVTSPARLGLVNILVPLRIFPPHSDSTLPNPPKKQQTRILTGSTKNAATGSPCSSSARSMSAILHGRGGLEGSEESGKRVSGKAEKAGDLKRQERRAKGAEREKGTRGDGDTSRTVERKDD